MYRVSFALTVFFALMMVLSRVMPLIHRGGWPLKFIILGALVIAAVVAAAGAASGAAATRRGLCELHSVRGGGQ